MIGRRFEAELLEAITSESGERVTAGLEELVDAGLMYRAGTGATRRYEFKHALVQMAAYESLLRRTRQDLHDRVARELAARFPDVVERQPEILAHHLAEARQWVGAIQHWLIAGQRSLVHSANQEAIAHLGRGLELLPNVADTREREPLELALLTTLGPALIATTGFASAQVGDVYARARALCGQLHGRPEFFPSLWGSWVFHLVRGDLGVAREFAEEMLRLGEQTGDSGMLVEAHWTLGDALYWLGHLHEADRHLSIAAALYDPEHHHVNALLYGQDPGVATHCYRSYTLWLLGHPAQAIAALDRAG